MLALTLLGCTHSAAVNTAPVRFAMVDLFPTQGRLTASFHFLHRTRCQNITGLEEADLEGFAPVSVSEGGHTNPLDPDSCEEQAQVAFEGLEALADQEWITLTLPGFLGEERIDIGGYPLAPRALQPNTPVLDDHGVEYRWLFQGDTPTDRAVMEVQMLDYTATFPLRQEDDRLYFDGEIFIVDLPDGADVDAEARLVNAYETPVTCTLPKCQAANVNFVDLNP
ncbi:MAG: hypothetical protein VX899_13725 [Myxococcota bacterium]|nr:hypothetical protein [Myxococcota bacterium]